jgi:hypothetical protein
MFSSMLTIVGVVIGALTVGAMPLDSVSHTLAKRVVYNCTDTAKLAAVTSGLVAFIDNM